jgi:hypothetical protein
LSADIIVSHGFGWAGDFVDHVGLLGHQSADPCGQAARSAEGFHGDAFVQIFGDEVALEDGFQFIDGARKHPGGNFFGANFEQQFDALVWLDHG